MRRIIIILVAFFIITEFAYSIVNLVSPMNNFRCQDYSVEFIWEPYPGGVRSYALRVSRYQDLSNPILDTSNLTTTSVIVNLPGANVQYYWQVKAIINPNPLVIDSSEIWTFTTMPYPPSTIEPQSNSNCHPLTVRFRWSPVNDARSYRVQISKTEWFLNILKDTVVTTTQADIKLPNWDTKYYWRVSATTNYGCTTYYSIVDSFKTNRTPPTLLEPADSITSIWGPINFAWNVPAIANVYNLQISTQSDFSIILYDEITSNPSLVKFINYYNTRFYWRVKAVYNDCETEFSKTRTFLTAYEPPTNLYPPNDTFCVSNLITFSWGRVNGATTYRLQVSQSDTFDLNRIVIDTLVTSRQFTHYFDKSLQYYTWRVRAEDPGNTGLWSDTSRFQTTFAPPKHINPSNGQETSVTVKLAWKRDIPFSTFELQVSDTNNFNLLQHRIYDLSGLTTDTFTIKLPHFNRKYWWRLRASDAYCKSDWSAPTYFLTKLQKPNLISPPNNAKKQPLKITFEWDKPEGWETFEIIISKDVDFRKIKTGRYGIVTNSVTISEFEPSTQYYWKVRAINKEDTSRWSDVFSFTTGPKSLEVPNLLYPLNNSDNLPLTFSFTWSNVPNSKYYQLQIAKDLQFNNIIEDIVNIPDTSYLISNLEVMTEYFWRVLAYNDSASSPWSNIWRFRTQPPLPNGPVYLSIPPNESMGTNVSLSLIWSPVQYAEFYHLQVATEEDFTQAGIVLDDSNLIQPQKYLTSLQYDTKYFWRVRAYNSAGSTPWSDTWWFKTMVSVVEDGNTLFLVSYNPIENSIQISANNELNFAKIQVFDTYGREIFVGSFDNRLNAISLPCHKLSHGLYMILISTKDKSYFFKFLF